MEEWGPVVSQWIAAAVAFIGGLFGGGLGAYLVKKGENRAIKEDIGKITSEIETVKAGITRLETEHEVRFTALHEKRAEVMAQLYRDIVAVEGALRECEAAAVMPNFGDHPEDITDVRRQEVFNEAGARAAAALQEAYDAFKQNLAEHEIYFQGNVLRQLQLLRVFSSQAYRDLYVALEANEEIGERLDRLQSAQNAVREKISAFKRVIEEEFRALLGVKEKEDE